MKFYHGTSYDNGMSIRHSEEFHNKTTNWEESEYGTVYFYREGTGEYSIDNHEGLVNALLNAQITSALQMQKGSTVAIVELNLPDNNPVIPDVSCERLSNIAVQFSEYELNQMIEEGTAEIEVQFFHDVYFDGMRYLYLAQVGDNVIGDLSPVEKDIIKALQKDSSDTASEIFEELIQASIRKFKTPKHNQTSRRRSVFV